MSLPIKAIERLFDRLMATYGDEFSRKWGATPMADVKSVWAHELSGYATRLDAVAWALENMPERAPNAIQFKALCRSAPAPAALQLQAPPPADPERVKSEMAKLGDVRDKVLTAKNSGKDWAHALKARQDAGKKLTLAQRTMLRAALGGTEAQQ